jgi:hypothetical protein
MIDLYMNKHYTSLRRLSAVHKRPPDYITSQLHYSPIASNI